MSQQRKNVIAIIPARGGSKGIPGKNLRPVGGLPLLVHSINHARAVPEISAVYVSTDDPQIAKVAREHGAEVIDRPASLSGDTATSESALVHALDTLAKGAAIDAVVFLQATSPRRDPSDLPAALTKFWTHEADSLFSATTATGFMWRVATKGPAPLNYDPVARPRRQDAPVDVVENGSFYIFKPSVLREHGSRLGGRIEVHMMPAENSFQIDEPFDLELMDMLFARGQREGRDDKHAKVRASLVKLGNVAHETAATLGSEIWAVGEVLADCIMRGNKVLAAGNGGSAADAQHFVAELVGRFMIERKALPAISLSSDPSVVTCLANDYGYETLFARQVEALGRPGDVLLAITTSGKSPNILNALKAARTAGMTVVSLTGSRSNTLAELSDHCLRIPSPETPVIQELHMAVLHILCASIDERFVV